MAVKRTECSYGCPIGSIALELHEPDPPVRSLLAANFDAWVAAVKRCLVETADRLPSSTDRHDLAVHILTTMEGAVMLSRTHRDLAPYDDAVRSLRRYFDLLQSAATAP